MVSEYTGVGNPAFKDVALDRNAMKLKDVD